VFVISFLSRRHFYASSTSSTKCF